MQYRPELRASQCAKKKKEISPGEIDVNIDLCLEHVSEQVWRKQENVLEKFKGI